MKNKTILKLSLSACAVAAAFGSSYANAADVPKGTELAKVQHIVINNGAEVPTLDPQKSQDIASGTILNNIGEALVYTGPDGEPLPGAAESWETKDNKVWTFHLRKDAKWSDGKPVTAQQFVHGWQRLADPKTASPYASDLETMFVKNSHDVTSGKKPLDALGVKALDDHTFQVTLIQPVPYLISIVNGSALMPIRKDILEKYGSKWTRPEHFVGNGAYKLDKWVVNEKIVLKRNPEYWDNEHTVIDEATFLPIESGVSDVNRYRAGEIDITSGAIPPPIYKKMQKDYGDEIHNKPYLCTFLYELNNKKKPFDDPRVRTAVKLTLDRDIITDKIMGQGQIPAYFLTPTFMKGGDFAPPAWSKWSKEERNKKAQELLKEAGYDKQHPLEFNLLYNTSDQNKQQAVAAAAMWKKNIGAHVTLQNQEWKTSLATRNQGNFQAMRMTSCAGYNDPSSLLSSFLSTSTFNTIGYSNKKFDEVLQKSLITDDETERRKLYEEAEHILDKDSATVPVYYRMTVRLVKPHVGGYDNKDPFDTLDLKRFYIKK